MYSEDDYTKLKTSLVKPESGFPSKYSLPYHAAKFSALNPVRLIAFSEIASEANEPELHSPPKSLPLHQKSSMSPDHSRVEQTLEQPSNGSASSPSQHAASSDGSRTVGSKSSHSSNHAAPRSSASNNSKKAASVKPSTRSSPSVVNCPPQMIPQMSAYEEETAYYKHDWELRAGKNSYAPPPFMAPWGEEEAVGGNNHRIDSTSNENHWPTPSSSHKQQQTYTARRRQNRQPRNDTPDNIQKPSAHNSWEANDPKPAHTGIQTFDGGWDDHVLEGDSTVSAPAPPPNETLTDGLAPTSERPIRCEIAMNKSRQRIDLGLPNSSSADWERFHKRTTRQKLCNEHHLRLACHDHACRYDHDEIDAGLLLALRHTARTTPCDFGPACRRHECYTSHRCPYIERPGGCRKQFCAFRRKGLHNITDLNIVDRIPLPKS